MKKDYKPVYIRGTKSGKGVIEALIAHGGINNCDYKGNCESNLYYIAPDTKFICGMDECTQFAPYLKATAEEIKPLRWRAEKDSPYYIVTATLKVEKVYEYKDAGDSNLYNCGNYFRTEAEAEEMAKKIKEILLSD